MALFSKKPSVTSSTPLYSVGATELVLIIGLGNPGKEHAGTRHSIGFAVLDEFAKQNNFPTWTNKGDLKCQLAITNIGDKRVILAKPQSFMNASGEAAQAIQKFYRVYNPSTLAVYDELSIPFGQLRTRAGGSDAGHNGVKSLIQHVGEDFGRLKVGIGNARSTQVDPADFVLSKFNKEERVNLPKIINEAGVLITEFVFGGGLSAETRTIL